MVKPIPYHLWREPNKAGKRLFSSLTHLPEQRGQSFANALTTGKPCQRRNKPEQRPYLLSAPVQPCPLLLISFWRSHIHSMPLLTVGTVSWAATPCEPRRGSLADVAMGLQ